MRVLGLDPGSQKLGWGLLERSGHLWVRVASGTVDLDRRRPLQDRLLGAYEAVARILGEHAPDLVAVEECFVAASPKAALVLGQVRGVLLLAVQQASIASVELSPRSVKLATVGRGGAAKEQVQYMVPRLIRDCPARLGPDEADALAIAWCGAQRATALKATANPGPASGFSGTGRSAAAPGRRLVR
jgi:crossover junction endodeoxyribonuclease RuvC